MAKENSKHLKLKQYAELLLEQAKLTAGMELENPVEFARGISQVMADALK
jgi:HSP90 family molecular chaperone